MRETGKPGYLPQATGSQGPGWLSHGGEQETKSWLAEAGKSPHPGKLSAQDVPHRVDLKGCHYVEVVRSFRGRARGEVGCGWDSGDISFSRN